VVTEGARAISRQIGVYRDVVRWFFSKRLTSLRQQVLRLGTKALLTNSRRTIGWPQCNLARFPHRFVWISLPRDLWDRGGIVVRSDWIVEAQRQ
jgi:hypothetical protein